MTDRKEVNLNSKIFQTKNLQGDPFFNITYSKKQYQISLKIKTKDHDNFFNCKN